MQGNPYKPGAGHMPPHLAGRQGEVKTYKRLLEQTTILKNMLLTGLRGVGKTVLLEKLKPIATRKKWFWCGTDLSESASVNEETVALRLLTDLSVLTSNIVVHTDLQQKPGFSGEDQRVDYKLNYQMLANYYNNVPGLISDKIKSVLEFAWEHIRISYPDIRGIVFVYDEAQTMPDHSEKEQYPLSLLLDVFQSLQRKDIPFMLILTGLPTLFPKLVNARTYSERMFEIIFLDKLNDDDSREAILKPLEKTSFKFQDRSVDIAVRESGGYPYFIQFICREAFDVLNQKMATGEEPSVPINEILIKLDSDFFSGRWAHCTDRQRDLLTVIAQLENCHEEFTVQEVAEKSKELLENPFSSSHITQMLVSLSKNGLVYKNRHGKYSFAVPLLNRFILRQANLTK